MNDSNIPEVVVVGSYNHDLLFRTERLPAPGETCLGEAAFAHGGKGFNQAVAAARLGARTRFLAAVGDDSFATDVRDFAEHEGIDARWQVCAAAPTGLASVTIDARGENQIVVAGGANLQLSPEHVSAGIGEGCRVVLAQLEVSPGAVSTAMRRARAAGAMALLNPAPASQAALELLDLADIVTPNQSEFAQLYGSRTDTALPPGWADGEDEQLHRYAQALDIATVIITLGPAGCFVSHAVAEHEDGLPYYRVPGHAVKANDTTGAGDCFNGALAAALSRDPGDFTAACRFANRAAAISVTRPGATPSMPRVAELG